MSQAQHVKTACPLDCWDTCSMIATVESGRVTELRGDETHPITQGTICSRGRRILDRTYSPYRILTPLKKVNGNWQPVSWDQALGEIAEKIRQTLTDFGHHAIFHNYDWGSGALLKSLNQRFFYQLGGCTETVGSLCWDAGLQAQTYDFGQARSHYPSDLGNASKIVVWGRNLPVTNMHMMRFVKTALEQGTEVAVINPLPTDLDHKASLVVRPRPGTDGALALGILKVCKDRGWLDEEFIGQSSVGFAELSSYLDTLTLQFVSEETDVTTADIETLADWYGNQGRVATLCGLGLQRYPGGGNTVRAIDALAAATGQIGVQGGGVNYANRQMAQFIDDEALTGRAKADVREFTRGEQADQILKADPPIQMMFVTRTNPVSQVPGTSALLEAYRQVPATVVVDTMMTETAELADYFLPCTTILEEEDISLSTMWHPYITFANRAIEPTGDTRSDYEIFTALADRLGLGESMRKPITEWFQLALSPLEPYGITLEKLRAEGTVRLPLPEVPFAGGHFPTPSGKYEFVSGQALADGVPGHARYVPTVETSRTRGDFATGDREGHAVDYLVEAENVFPYALLTIHPRTSENSQHRAWPDTPESPTAQIPEAIAHNTGLSTGDMATLKTRHGELLVTVKVVDEGHPRTILLESGWTQGGRTINHLTLPAKADLGQQTAQYDVACQLVAVE